MAHELGSTLVWAHVNFGAAVTRELKARGERRDALNTPLPSHSAQRDASLCPFGVSKYIDHAQPSIGSRAHAGQVQSLVNKHFKRQLEPSATRTRVVVAAAAAGGGGGGGTAAAGGESFEGGVEKKAFKLPVLLCMHHQMIKVVGASATNLKR